MHTPIQGHTPKHNRCIKPKNTGAKPTKTGAQTKKQVVQNQKNHRCTNPKTEGAKPKKTRARKPSKNECKSSQTGAQTSPTDRAGAETTGVPNSLSGVSWSGPDCPSARSGLPGHTPSPTPAHGGLRGWEPRPRPCTPNSLQPCRETGRPFRACSTSRGEIPSTDPPA